MGMNGSANLRQQWGLDLTQLMYTPEQKATYPIYNQHPYVGNLTLGLTSLVKNEDRANSWSCSSAPRARISPRAPSISSISCGVWAMARLGQPAPGEMTANLFFKRYYRLRGLEKRYGSGFETDALAYWHADAGTVKVQAGAACPSASAIIWAILLRRTAFAARPAQRLPSFITGCPFPIGGITVIFMLPCEPWLMTCIWMVRCFVPPQVCEQVSRSGRMGLWLRPPVQALGIAFRPALHDQGVHPAGIHAVCGRSPAPAYFLTAAFAGRS